MVLVMMYMIHTSTILQQRLCYLKKWEFPPFVSDYKFITYDETNHLDTEQNEVLHVITQSLHEHPKLKSSNQTH